MAYEKSDCLIISNIYQLMPLELLNIPMAAGLMNIIL
jgi:hypothetical protein